MRLQNLSDMMDVELLVSPVGNAMVMHMGDFEEDYVWAQYNQYDQSIEFVTEEGAVQGLGIQVQNSMSDPLKKVKELFLVKVHEDYTTDAPRLIKFSALAEV